jgi:hypothetical protein
LLTQTRSPSGSANLVECLGLELWWQLLYLVDDLVDSRTTGSENLARLGRVDPRSLRLTRKLLSKRGQLLCQSRVAKRGENLGGKLPGLRESLDGITALPLLLGLSVAALGKELIYLRKSGAEAHAYSPGPNRLFWIPRPATAPPTWPIAWPCLAAASASSCALAMKAGARLACWLAATEPAAVWSATDGPTAAMPAWVAGSSAALLGQYVKLERLEVQILREPGQAKLLLLKPKQVLA